MLSRVHKIDYPSYWWLIYDPGYHYQDPPVTTSWSDDLLISENHPDWYENTNRSVPTGGDFYVKRRFYEEYSSLGLGPISFSSDSTPDTGVYHYSRPQRAWIRDVENKHFPTLDSSPYPDLSAYGRKCIAETAPTNKEFDFSQFLGELREGIPRSSSLVTQLRSKEVRNSFGNISKAASQDYLSYQFAVNPTIRDIKKLSHTVVNAGKLWRQYKRNSGKMVKRRREEPTERTTSITDMGSYLPVDVLGTRAYSAGYEGRTKVTRIERTSTKRWFSASYLYWLPDSDIGEFVSLANHVFGTTFSVYDLYALTPFSWMLNWFSDANVLFKNMSLFATDSLVMPWAYVMEHKTSEVEYLWQGDVYKTYPGNHWMRQILRTETKRRITASPYGFDLNWADFSPFQLSILGALGISKR